MEAHTTGKAIAKTEGREEAVFHVGRLAGMSLSAEVQ